MSTIKHFDIVVTGRVQGVFYRDTACRQARRYGIHGWVRNERNGSVHIEAEGEEELLNRFVGWCHQGSPWAQVDEVQYKEAPVVGYNDFRARYDIPDY